MIYMPEATVKAAKLQRKSAAELKEIGIGKDSHGYYLLSSPSLNIPVPQRGVMATLKAVANIGSSVADIAAAKLGSPASPKEVDRRKAICMTCYDVDASGRRLFRIHGPGRMSCGQPMDPRVEGAKVLRDPLADGCGCWLNEKWQSREQSCPRGKWGPEKSSKPAPKSAKRRCCGNS